MSSSCSLSAFKVIVAIFEVFFAEMFKAVNLAHEWNKYTIIVNNGIKIKVGKIVSCLLDVHV